MNPRLYGVFSLGALVVSGCGGDKADTGTAYGYTTGTAPGTTIAPGTTTTGTYVGTYGSGTPSGTPTGDTTYTGTVPGGTPTGSGTGTGTGTGSPSTTAIDTPSWHHHALEDGSIGETFPALPTD